MEPLYVLFDVIAKAILGSPQVFVNDEVSRRYFRDVLMDKQSPLAAHPRDYELWRIGELDRATMSIKAVTPLLIARGRDVMEAESNA